MTLELQRFGPEPNCSVDVLAVKERDAALALASFVAAVTTKEQQEEAVNALKALKRVISVTEEDRKAIKAPVLNLGSLIDDAAKSHVAAVKTEVSRIEAAVSAFQEEERRKYEAALKAQREKEAEIERQRLAAIQEALRKEREAMEKAQAERRKAEQEAIAAKTELARVEANQRAAVAAAQMAEAKKKALEDANKASMQATAARRETQATAQSAAPARAEGLIVREAWQFEVIDINQLYSLKPELVRIEANQSAIQAAIRAGLRKCPGLIIWSETKSGVRTSEAKIALPSTPIDEVP